MNTLVQNDDEKVPDFFFVGSQSLTPFSLGQVCLQGLTNSVQEGERALLEQKGGLLVVID
jgi:hypothetical protein